MKTHNPVCMNRTHNPLNTRSKHIIPYKSKRKHIIHHKTTHDKVIFHQNKYNPVHQITLNN